MSIHKQMYIYIFKHFLVYQHSYIHTYIHTHANILIHSYSYMYTHAYVLIQIGTYLNVHLYIKKGHLNTKTDIHTLIQIYKRTYKQ